MNEFEQVMEAAMLTLRQGHTAVLVTILAVRGSAPRHTNARMLIHADGRTMGTIGGASLEQQVKADAQAVFDTGQSRKATYVLNPKDEHGLGLCGGSVEVFIECLAPKPTLILLGAGHIAQALARFGSGLGFHIVVVDDRAEYACSKRFPDGTELYLVDYDASTEQLAPLPVVITPTSYVVVATWGWDLPALAQVLGRGGAYVGLVASKVKWQVLARRLRELDLPEDVIDKVRAPSGLALGAETPDEIALSILAEIYMVRRKASGLPLTSISSESRPHE